MKVNSALIFTIISLIIHSTKGDEDEENISAGFCSRGGDDCESLKSMAEELAEIEQEMFLEETIQKYNQDMLDLVRTYSDAFETDVAKMSTDPYTILTTMYKNAERLGRLDIFKQMRIRAFELTMGLKDVIGPEEYQKYTDLSPMLDPMRPKQQ
ncbi:hypothetical protein B566_EDAN010095 [Ephemera danica]|nr:hypothetical protein B566_EDAN010095 [Ephemera danica]